MRPTSLVSRERAVTLVVCGHAQVIAEDESVVYRSQHLRLALPVILQVPVYVELRPIVKHTVVRRVLFCRDKDAEREIWDGFRYGPEGARAAYGLEEAHSITRLDELMPELISDRVALYCHLGADPAWDARVMGWINQVRGRARTGVTAPGSASFLSHPAVPTTQTSDTMPSSALLFVIMLLTKFKKTPPLYPTGWKAGAFRRAVDAP